VRFGIAAVLMVLVWQRQVRALSGAQIRVGVALGCLYGAAQLLQTVGLAHTDASRSGFITGTYVVLTPVFGAVLLRERPTWPTWAGVALATAGLAVLSLHGFGVGYGEALTFAAAAMYALHIVGLGRFSTSSAVVGLATVQMVVIALICLVAALPGGIEVPSTGHGWASLCYMAVVAGAGALWAQTWAQAQLPAARAAIVMTLEPVFASAFAIAFGGDSLTARMLLGGVLVLAAMYLVELLGRDTEPNATGKQSPPSEALHHDV
jgi:drug/metabolite transporter (DMT)-like permease